MTDEESIAASPLQVEASISWTTVFRSCPSRHRIYVTVQTQRYLAADMIDRVILRCIPLEIGPHLLITLRKGGYISRIRTLRERMVQLAGLQIPNLKIRSLLEWDDGYQPILQRRKTQGNHPRKIELQNLLLPAHVTLNIIRGTNPLR